MVVLLSLKKGKERNRRKKDGESHPYISASMVHLNIQNQSAEDQKHIKGQTKAACILGKWTFMSPWPLNKVLEVL